MILAAVLVSGAVVAGLSWQAAGSADDLDVSLDQGVAEVEDWLVEGPLDLPRERVEEVDRQARDWLSSGDGLISSIGVDEARLAVEVVAGILLAIVLTFFFVKDGERIWRWLTQGLGRRAGPHVDEAGRRAWRTVGAFIRGTAIVAAVDAVFIGIAMALLGVPLVVPLAVLTFVGGFLPLVGAVVAGALAVLVALASEGFVTALILLAVVIAVQQIEGDVLQPVVMGRVLRLHPIAILLAVAAGPPSAGSSAPSSRCPSRRPASLSRATPGSGPGRRRLPAIRAPPRSGISGEAARFPRCPAGYQSAVARIKLTYWALISVLGALTFFLVAAGARLLRWRLGGNEADGG